MATGAVLSRSALRAISFTAFALTWMLIGAGAASAQFLSTSSIEGVVTDETGGALPGVTISVSGPALQVAQLATVTDGQGSYKFPQLPGGVFNLRFELAGFQSVVREKLEVAGGFAARVNMSMKVGGLEETLTVSGASPVVDVTSTTASQTLSADMVNRLIPTSRQLSDVLRLAPGVKSTLPPQFGVLGISTLGGVKAFGTTTTTQTMDGVDQASAYNDTNAAQELEVKMFGNTPDVQDPGVYQNIITKSGGNDLHASINENYMNVRFQSTNIDDDLRAQNLSFGDSLRYLNDIGGDVGGRLKRDKLWYYVALRARNNSRTVAGFAANAGADGKYGTGDDPPYYTNQGTYNWLTKLSYQVKPSTQLIFFHAADNNLIDAVLGDIPERANRYNPREAVQDETYQPTEYRGELRVVARKNLLFNAQVGTWFYKIDYYPVEPGKSITRRFDRETQIYTGSPTELIRPVTTDTAQGNLTYLPEQVLGSHGHQFKVGYRLLWQLNATGEANLTAGNYQLVYDRVGGLSHQPVEISIGNQPVEPNNRSTTYSTFANDQWQINPRVTVNIGVRFDRSHAYLPAQTKASDAFGYFPSGSYARFDGNTFNVFAPRLGVAWDVTGNSRTVLKATYGRFNISLGPTGAELYNQNTYATANFKWTDLDGNNDYTPGIGEATFIPSLQLSATGGINSIYNPDLKSAYQHELTGAFDRELAANVAVRVLYVFREDVNAILSTNILRAADLYTVPISRRDPGPDGVLDTKDDPGAIITLWDYPTQYRGAAFVGNMRVNRPDTRPDKYHTIEFVLTKRTVGKWGVVASAGVTKNDRWQIGLPVSPNDNYFPKDETWESSYKINGSYQLPYGFQFGGLFEIQPGLRGQRTYVFRSADPDKGPSFPSSSTITVRLDEYGTDKGPIRHHSHMRLGRVQHIGRMRMQLNLDAFNIFNSNSQWVKTFVSGPTFGYTQRILSPRVLQFGAVLDF